MSLKLRSPLLNRVPRNPGQPSTACVTEDGPELLVPLPPLPGAGTTGVHHLTWFTQCWDAIQYSMHANKFHQLSDIPSPSPLLLNLSVMKCLVPDGRCSKPKVCIASLCTGTGSTHTSDEFMTERV